MRRFFLVAVALAGAVALTTSAGAAQDFGSSVGWNGGVVLTTSLNGGGGEGEGGVDLKPDPTWFLGAHYDRWLGAGRAGARITGGVSRRTLPWVQGDRTIYSYWGDVGLLLRLAPVSPDRTVFPFLSGGVGFVFWGLGNGSTTSFPAAGAQYGGDEKFHLAGNAGLGFDIVTPWNWGEGPMLVRLEVRDLIQLSSPFDPVEAEASDFGIVHNPMISLGFHTGMGTLRGGY